MFGLVVVVVVIVAVVVIGFVCCDFEHVTSKCRQEELAQNATKESLRSFVEHTRYST